MKPFIFAILIVVALGYYAAKDLRSVAADLTVSGAAIGIRQTDLDKEEAKLASTKEQVQRALEAAPKIDNFIKCWADTLPSYDRLSEETVEERKKRDVQITKNSETNPDEVVRLRNRDFRASRRVYSISGKLADALNYLGYFETRFELLQFSQLTVRRQGEKTVCDCVFLKPKLEIQ
jgi:hypothetical protein